MEGQYRIIPAYAGKSYCEKAGIQHYRDHPRIRGEKSKTLEIVEVNTGSSPHTRGKVRRNNVEIKFTRIIPAYAGKSYIKKLHA